METKVVLVTGASSGLGAHIAVTLASLGYALSLSGRNVTALRETARKCAEVGQPPDRRLLVPGDLRLEEAVENAVDRTVERFGRLDALVNSAGEVAYGPIANVSMDTLDRVFDTNVRSVFYLIQQALPHLSRTEGSVINLSAGCASRTVPLVSVYCASKAALNHLTLSMALEFAEQKVRVNAITLNAFPTGIHQRAGFSPTDLAYIFDPDRIPLGRTGTLNDVSQAVAFLVNKTQSSFVTGVLLPVQGGEQLLGKKGVVV